jgi:hypothetical protein
MEMDPVVGLMEELRAAELEMDAACKQNAKAYCRDRAERINAMLGKVKGLYGDILNTPPTSTLGASIVIRIVAGRMPFAHARYGDHLHRIADRLERGERAHADLVWLRAIAEALPNAGAGKAGAHLGLLITRAIGGIARPVVVYRAVLPPLRRPPDWQHLALGPG